jgi:sodium/proline symporter
MSTIAGINMPYSFSALAAFVGYFILVSLIGVVAFMATRNLSDYVLGGRRLGGAVAALSAGASDMSSWLLMGLPGAVFALGLKEIWASIGLTIGAYTCWRLVAKPLRIYSEVAKDSVTLPAYLDNRFRDDSRSIRMVAALATLVFFVFYVAAGLYASGILLSRTFGIDYTHALWIGAAIVMLYTSLGGFLAVSWTDFFQGNLMLICLLVVPFFAIQNLGGWNIGLEKISSVRPEYVEWTQGLSFSKFVSLFAWGLGYFGMPHILVRFMAVKSVKEIPLARRVCIGWMTLSLIGAVLVGVVGAIHFSDSPLGNPETVFMELSEQVFAPWIMGIILAAILSSSMCAIDSQMLAASSALTEDFYRTMLRRNASQRELVWVGRITTAIIAIVGIYIARNPQQSIMGLVEFAWSGLGATFGAAVVLSLFWRRTTRNGIVVGMVLGGVTVIIWKLLGFDEWMNAILPGVILSYLGVFITSMLDKVPSEEILQEFEKVRRLVKDNIDTSVQPSQYPVSSN